jgi:hypothetical protein
MLIVGSIAPSGIEKTDGNHETQLQNLQTIQRKLATFSSHVSSMQDLEVRGEGVFSREGSGKIIAKRRE